MCLCKAVGPHTTLNTLCSLNLIGFKNLVKVFNIIQSIEFLNHNSEVKKDQMFHYNLKWTRQLLIFRRTCCITLQEHQTIPINATVLKNLILVL